MKETNKRSSLLIIYTEKLYKIIYSIKLKLKVSVKFLLNILMKIKMNLFYKHEQKTNLNFFSHNKIKYKPRT